MSILIKNGLIYPGDAEPIEGDILIEGEKITKIGQFDANADTVIDAKGMIVTPGFIDAHRHTDIRNYMGWNGLEMLRQGITTTVAGNCGITAAPCLSAHAEEQRAFDEVVLGPAGQNTPETFPEYLQMLDNVPLPVNTASLIGTGSVRISLKGFASTPFSDSEMAAGQNIIDEALAAGAYGVSMGIMYLPECYASTDEFSRLLKPLGKRKGVLATHIRGEGDGMLAAVREVISIAERVGCPLEISHFKGCGVHNWRKSIYEAIDLIEKAQSRGQDVSVDFYPYDGGSTALTTMLPPSFVAGDMENALTRLGTKEGVDAFRKAARVHFSDWDNFAITLGWERILISGVADPENEKYLGLNVTAAAEKYGFSDPESLAAHLMHTDHGKTAIINMSMCQDDIDAIAKLPYSIVISDSIYAKTDTPHPRMFGAMPKFLREYVMERKLFTMQEAIRKMTAQPAKRFGIEKRGTLAVGNFADVLVFDPNVFRDNATYESPAHYASGLSYSIINGRIILENDVLRDLRVGKNLRRR